MGARDEILAETGSGGARGDVGKCSAELLWLIVERGGLHGCLTLVDCPQVDCTAALNLKHVHEKDNGWLRHSPAAGDALRWDEVTTLTQPAAAASSTKMKIVAYGNGVVTKHR